MGTIAPRKRKNGSTSYQAQIVIKKDGKRVHTEARTFDRRGAAAAWLKRREGELHAPGGIEAARQQADGVTLNEVIDRYTTESASQIGRTKAQVLRSIKTHEIAEQRCAEIGSDDIVSLARTLAGEGRKPQTVANYLSHLAAIFAIARPAWRAPLDQQAMRDAMTVAKRLGYTGKSVARDRRPTMEELDRLMSHFWERSQRDRRAAPMHRIIAYAIFSTRRQEEITRITWADLDAEGSRQMVRDMKHPGQKIGNDAWCDLTPEALAITQATPRSGDRIFPYGTDAISASFTRACKMLAIEDLHFHDLRHEGVSRLFEMGWNIPHVAAVSGHRSWQSLKRYTQLRNTGDCMAGWRWLPRVTGTGAPTHVSAHPDVA